MKLLPQRVICDKCGALLYEGKELKAPNEIIESYDGKCPNCGRKLSYVPEKAEVKPVDKANRLRRGEKRKRRYRA